MFNQRTWHAAFGGYEDRRTCTYNFYQNPKSPEEKESMHKQIEALKAWTSENKKILDRVGSQYHPWWLDNPENNPRRDRWIKWLEEWVVVDFSTSYPPSTRKLAETLKSRGIDLLDAPLTGSKAQADTGTLNVIGSGPEKTFERIKLAFNAIASNVFYVGSAGMGHTVKLINNYLGQANLAALCEILVFAQTYGVDLNKLYEVVSVSGGNSSSFQVNMPRLMVRDFAINFQQKFVLKDIRYMINFARETGVPTPLADNLLALHEQAFANGYGEEDTTALLKFFEENSSGSSTANSR